MERKNYLFCVIPCIALLALWGCPPSTPGPTTVPYPGPTTATICVPYSYTASVPVTGSMTSSSGPPWLTIADSGTAITLTGTPQGNDWGAWPITAAGSDATGAKVVVSGTITVTPTPTITLSSPSKFRWKLAAGYLSNMITMTVSPACVYTVTAATQGVLPSGVSFTPVPGASFSTTAAGTANLRVQASQKIPNDAGDLILTITSNAPGGATVTRSIPIEYIQ
ncbi:MAG TPA: hypothetical protein VKO18_06730 [Terriglobia bacterium]|nr:hypothetical protein [Terriglobia bacterium]